MLETGTTMTRQEEEEKPKYKKKNNMVSSGLTGVQVGNNVIFSLSKLLKKSTLCLHRINVVTMKQILIAYNTKFWKN